MYICNGGWGDPISTTIVDSDDRVVDPSDAVNVRVYLSSEFGSGYIQLAPDGMIKHINYPS